jgi:hypothetical protein
MLNLRQPRYVIVDKPFLIYNDFVGTYIRQPNQAIVVKTLLSTTVAMGHHR